jgi:hypothetical protein
MGDMTADVTTYRQHKKRNVFNEAKYDLRRRNNGLEDFSYDLRNDFSSRIG